MSRPLVALIVFTDVVAISLFIFCLTLSLKDISGLSDFERAIITFSLLFSFSGSVIFSLILGRETWKKCFFPKEEGVER